MAHARFLGLSNPEADFEALRVYREALLKLEHRIRPNTADALIMESARRALETAAHHFTRDRDFYMRARQLGHTA